MANIMLERAGFKLRKEDLLEDPHQGHRRTSISAKRHSKKRSSTKEAPEETVPKTIINLGEALVPKENWALLNQYEAFQRNLILEKKEKVPSKDKATAPKRPSPKRSKPNQQKENIKPSKRIKKEPRKTKLQIEQEMNQKQTQGLLRTMDIRHSKQAGVRKTSKLLPISAH